MDLVFDTVPAGSGAGCYPDKAYGGHQAGNDLEDGFRLYRGEPDLVYRCCR